MKYVIQYNYNMYQLGCECCYDSDGHIYIYESNRVDEGVYTSFIDDAGYIYDEEHLRKYISDMFPEFNDFTVHHETEYA